MLEPISKIPDGMRYHTGAEARLRRHIEDTVVSVFNGWCYEETSTPAIDYYALFERGMGADAASRAFRFADSDGALLALRPDVTSTLARAAATLLKNRPRPLRLSYAASVWRGQASHRAEWRRERKHLGCELIGAPDSGEARTSGDAEMLAIIGEVITRLDLQNRTRITINNVQIFNGIAERLRLDGRARESLRSLMDKRDAPALKNFLLAHTDTKPESIDDSDVTNDAEAFARIIRLSGRGEMFCKARAVISNEKSVSALDELERLWKVVDTFVYANMYAIDFGDASQLDYYTGTVFKIYIAGAGAQAGGGGRYDELISAFGGTDTAVGFMLDLDALTDALVCEQRLAKANEEREVETISDADTAAQLNEAISARQENKRVRIK